MSDVSNDLIVRKGVWLPIEQADKAKKYDLIVSDGEGYRWRETNCFWKRGGSYGQAGWYYADEGQWCPVKAVDFFRATHFMEVPEFPV